MDQIAKEITKRDGVVVRIGRGYLQGFEFGEIRQFKRDKHRMYVQTDKGMTFKPELVDELIEGLQELKLLFTE